MQKFKPTTVVEYIAMSPSWSRSTLKQLRQIIKTVAPEAKESISYNMPYYSQNGRLAYFAAFKNHCSFFWISSEDKKIFEKELAKQKIVGSTLHIPRGKKIPTTLIKKIIKMRIKKNSEHKKI